MILTASALKRPTAKWLARYRIEAIRNDTVAEYLAKGFSLAICCRACPRLTEWTPHELQRRYGNRPHTRIADIAARLSCKGEDGCGSDDIAVWPHAYEGEWRPPLT